MIPQARCAASQCQQSISQPQQAAAAAPAAPAATPQGLQCSFSMVTALAPLLTLGLLGGSLALPQQQQQDPCPVNPPKQAGTAASCALSSEMWAVPRIWTSLSLEGLRHVDTEGSHRAGG